MQRSLEAAQAVVVLQDHALPLPVYTNGIDARPWMPLGPAWDAWLAGVRGPTPPDAITSGWLRDTVARGAPTCVFLLPPRESVLRTAEPDALPALLDAQAASSRPVQVLPVANHKHLITRPEALGPIGAALLEP